MSVIGFSKKEHLVVNCEKISIIDKKKIKDKLNSIKMENTNTHLAIEEVN
jgi:hypothetical protein